MGAPKILENPVRPTAFGELGAKQSQDNKPYRVLVEACPDRFDRLRPLEPLVASQSLGDGTIPSLAVPFEADPAPLIPARPFGLRLRFDEALLVAPVSRSARSVKPTPNDRPTLAQSRDTFKRRATA
jgi:hypothetical protein